MAFSPDSQRRGTLAALFIAALICGCSQTRPGLTAEAGPVVREELRAVFVTTAFNIDWPTQRHLDVQHLKDEIDEIVHRTQAVNCNVIILQVRSFADRIHRHSDLSIREPWSDFLNDGDDPDDNASFDPLCYWINRCHQQGIELHLWVNPFRCKPDRYPGNQNQFQPLLYDADTGWYYLDPSKPAVLTYVYRMIQDLIDYKNHCRPMQDEASTRTKSRMAESHTEDNGDGGDGLIFDHYWGPGPHLGERRKPPASRHGEDTTIRKTAKTVVPEGCGPNAPPSRGDLDDFIHEVYNRVHTGGMKFGLSPQCKDPNAKRWARNGWCHYVVPEVYVRAPDNSNAFQGVLQPWLARDLGSICVAPALNSTMVYAKRGSPWDKGEIFREIKSAREYAPGNSRRAQGQAHYSFRALRPDVQDDLATVLVQPSTNDDHYDKPSIVPVCRRIISNAPAKPVDLALDHRQGSWSDGGGEPVFQWAVWFYNGQWGDMQVYPASVTAHDAPEGVSPTNLAVMAIGRHNERSLKAFLHD